MKRILLPVLLLASAHAFADCIPLGGDDDFQRVSDTQLIVTDTFNQKYQVSVESCPDLMMGYPIVINEVTDELCDGDILRVGMDVCPVDSIQKVARQ